MSAPRANECRIGVGPVTLSIRCPSAGYAESLRDYFATGLVERMPDLELDLEILPETGLPRVPDSLFTTKVVTGDEFVIDDGLVTGRYRPGERSGRLRVHGLLTKEPLTRVFEQLLYQAFYSARLQRDEPAALIHACGVIRDGEGFLFVGESGAGKSTVARHSATNSGRVLNDEICLVEFAPDGPVLHSTPFNGLFPGKVAGSAPLRTVFLLEHGPAHRVAGIGSAEAISRLTGQVVAPLPLQEQISAATSTAMLDIALRLATAAPVRRLEFTPDPGFWPIVLRDAPAKERNA